MLYQIVKETGWSWHTVLWKVSRPNLILMLADRPTLRNEGAQGDKEVKVLSGKDLAKALRGS